MKHTPEAEAVTELILELFRLNGQLLTAGDKLTKPLELTSARWQVLGSMELAGRPLTVPQIGRRMGLSRQAVQRVANDLEALGFLTFEDNPDHARAKLLVPTAKGRATLEKIGQRQIKWANLLTHGMQPKSLQTAVTVLRELQSRCETTKTTDL